MKTSEFLNDSMRPIAILGLIAAYLQGVGIFINSIINSFLTHMSSHKLNIKSIPVLVLHRCNLLFTNSAN